MDENTEKILELVFQGAVALAGLILVFLGFVFTAFDSYDETQKRAVRKRYRSQAIQALVGFLAALLAAAVSLFAYSEHWPSLYYVSLSAFAVSFVMVALVAVKAVLNMG